MWPMNLDVDSMGAPTANSGQGQAASVNTASTGVFMGASTPGTSGNIL